MCVCRVSFFFFKQKTAYEMRISDWSSDVCSSDLRATRHQPQAVDRCGYGGQRDRPLVPVPATASAFGDLLRLLVSDGQYRLVSGRDSVPLMESGILA